MEKERFKKKTQKKKNNKKKPTDLDNAMSDYSDGSASHGLFSRMMIHTRRPSNDQTTAVQTTGGTRPGQQGRRSSLGGGTASFMMGRRPSLDYQPSSLREVRLSQSPGKNVERPRSFRFGRRHSIDGSAHHAVEPKILAAEIVAQDSKLAIMNVNSPTVTQNNGAFHKDSPQVMNAKKKFKAKNLSKIPDKTLPKVHPVVQALIIAMEKDHLMDVTLCGKDGVQVKASRYVLACRNEALQLLLYEQDPPAASINLGNYNYDTLNALVVYCFTGTLTKSPISHETADAARGLVRLADLARVYDFRVLYDEAYQMARTWMNRKPPLACAFYDEASGAKVKDFEMYALQTIEDVPMESLLGTEKGIQYLSHERLGPILSHREMKVDEMTVFWMLKRWVEHQGQNAESMEIAKQHASKINLKFIEATELRTAIKFSGFFDDEAIDEAIMYQAMMASKSGTSFSQLRRQGNLNDENLERVVVTGAGNEIVNGTYYRVIEERDESSILFTKEGNGGLEVFGLYLWGNQWGIASEIDLSNTYYHCERSLGDHVPEKGWNTGEMGQPPSPICTWMSGTSSNGETAMRRQLSTDSLPPCFASEEDLYGN